MSFTRRRFLGAAAAGLAASPAFPAPAADPKELPKVAAVFTEFRFRSHAFNILENFLEPYLFQLPVGLGLDLDRRDRFDASNPPNGFFNIFDLRFDDDDRRRRHDGFGSLLRRFAGRIQRGTTGEKRERQEGCAGTKT